MSTFDVIEFSNDDINLINAINSTHPRGPQMIPCCYTLGETCTLPSLSVEDLLNNVLFIEWKNALESLAPMNTRPRHTVTTNIF